MQTEAERLRLSAGRAPVLYEVFPVVTYRAADAPLDWLEIALHAEADIYEPLDCPESREAVAVLEELAGFLRRSMPADGRYDLKLTRCYYTARPPTAGKPANTARLFRSMSLVIFNIPSYRTGEEPPLLARLKAALQELNIARMEEAA